MAARPQQIILVAPPPRFPSGGHLYNQRLIQALGELTKVVGLLPTDLDALPADADGVALIDTLCADAVGHPRLQRARPVLLAHLLPSQVDDSPGVRARESLQLAQFSGAVATSAIMAAALAARGVQNSLTLEPAPPNWQPEPLRAPQTPIRALMVANLSPVKGVAAFLAALSTAGGGGFEIDVIGDTTGESAAQQAAEHPALRDRVRFLGGVSPDALESHYRHADLFVSASRFESFGMAMQEARTVGLPLLVRDGGNAAQHVENGVTGYVLPDAAALARTFVNLAEQPDDLARLTANARRAAVQLPRATWADSAARLLDFLAHALGSPR